MALTKQQRKFKRAQKKCARVHRPGSSGFAACMSRELKKRKG